VRFSLLGPLVVADGEGNRAALTGPRLRVMLVALLLHANIPVPADELAELVWDGSPSAGAAATLRSYAARLRRALGVDPARIVAQHPGYLIRAARQELDVLQFEALCADARAALRAGQWKDASAAAARALGLWRAAPLLDIPSETLRGKFVPRLERLRLQALEDGFDAGLRLGRYQELAPQLLDMTTRHPLQERFHAQLMLALAAAGRRAQALDAYQRARRALIDELGIEPGPELRTVHQRILAADAQSVAATVAPQPPAGTTAGSPPASVAVPRQLPPAAGYLTGRDGELEVSTPHGYDPSDGLADHKADAAAAAPPGRTGAAAQDTAGHSPRHLLPDTALFTGRDREIGALIALAGQAGSGGSPGAVVISAIEGMGGVGKTALALHAAHRLGGQFPDGHLFIDLAGFTAGTQPLDPSQALAELLRDLGIPPQLIPDGLEARAAFYRNLLHGTRTLIVLDNAASEDQVRPLLPGTGTCLVLITSRKRLPALDDALPLPLDVLAPAEAVTLLRRAARLPAAPASHGDGEEEEETRLLDQVAGLCGCLPLALLIAAALLRAHGRAWTLDHLITRLAAAPLGRELAPFDDGTRNLTVLFDVSYHAMTAGQQEFYRRLGVLPGPEIDGYAAAALLASDPEQAGELLGQLAGCSLLEAASPDRYRMHDLLRAHARALAVTDPGSGEAARARLYHYYQHTARRAATLTTLIPRPGPDGPAPAHAPPLPDAGTAWAWLRAELANLQAAIDHAGRHGLSSDLITLTAGIATVLYTDGPWPQAMSLHQTAAAVAGRLGDHRGQAGALTDLGYVRMRTGDHPGATDALTQAMQVYRDLGDRRGHASALTGLGDVRMLTGDFPGATDALAQALQVYRDLGDRRGQADALTGRGEVRRLTGDYPGAIDALAQALQVYRDLGDRRGQAIALTGLGEVRRLTGDYPGATDALAQALQAARDLGNRLGQAIALARLGEVRRLTGDYPGAADALTQALHTFRDLSDRLGMANALTGLGEVRRLTGDYPGAADALTQALQIFRDLESRGSEAWALNYYAAAVRAGGNVARALELYRQALAMNRELGKPDDEAIALEGTGECLLARGRAAEGTACLRQSLELYQRLGMRADTERLTAHLTALTPRKAPRTG
jgi:DNA-binding SARP family transcriptional activator/tetratricopeptide (TPR) repeat protein